MATNNEKRDKRYFTDMIKNQEKILDKSLRRERKEQWHPDDRRIEDIHTTMNEILKYRRALREVSGQTAEDMDVDELLIERYLLRKTRPPIGNPSRLESRIGVIRLFLESFLQDIMENVRKRSKSRSKK